MRLQLRRWFESASVRIPASIKAAAALRRDREVDVPEDAGQVGIEPVQRLAYNLDSLLDQIKPENVHRPVDWGPPVGREIA